MEIWEPKTPGTLWATLGLLRDTFSFCRYLYLSVSIVGIENALWLDGQRSCSASDRLRLLKGVRNNSQDSNILL